MSVKRPTYIPQRMDWFPGEPESNRKVTIREALASDAHQIRALLGRSFSDKTMYRWLAQADYTVSLAVRNARTAIGVCISRHTPDCVEILHLFVHPEYEAFPIDERLLLLAALELPERPCRITVPAYDEDRCSRLRDLGYRCVKSETDEGDRVFEYRFLRREDRDGRGADASGEGPDDT